MIAPAGGHIRLLNELCQVLPEPFGLLYVLLVSHDGNEPGRYQSPNPTSRQETTEFLRGFVDFLEGDGRHHLWVMSLADQAHVVYDNNDLLYGYGPLDRYRTVLHKRGIAEAAAVTVPAPHVHHYHPELVEEERRLVRYWEWRRFPLQPIDDDV